MFRLMRLVALTLVLVNLFAGTAVGQFAASRVTHPRAAAATWFHGWYTRITLDNGCDTIGVVTASFFNRNTHGSDDRSGGYVAIMKRNVATGELEVYEDFPRRTRVIVSRQPLRCEAEDVGFSRFRWEAEGIGVVTEKEISIVLPNGASLGVTLGDRRPWDARFPWRGPEGIAEHLRLLRCHWNVYSLASRATVSLTTPAGAVVGAGFAHQETSWGETFPRAYAWAQGSSADGRINFAVAGGVLPVGNRSYEGWLLGLRTARTNWDFRPQVPGTVFTTHVDAPRGRLTMTARSLLKTVELEVSALPSSFALLAVPTQNGFAYDTMQSFSGRATIRAYEQCPGGFGRRLVEAIEIPNTALEFGGDYRQKSEMSPLRSAAE